MNDFLSCMIVCWQNQPFPAEASVALSLPTLPQLLIKSELFPRAVGARGVGVGVGQGGLPPKLFDHCFLLLTIVKRN